MSIFFLFINIYFLITSLIPSNINHSRKQINSLSAVTRATCALHRLTATAGHEPAQIRRMSFKKHQTTKVLKIPRGASRAAHLEQ